METGAFNSLDGRDSVVWSRAVVVEMGKKGDRLGRLGRYLRGTVVRT